jgi:hypothetical protein
MVRPQGLSGKERADEKYALERIQVSTLENNLLAAMSHSQAACMYAKGGVGTLVELEEGFRACTSYSQWISGVDSTKKVLEKQPKDFTIGIVGSMVPSSGGNALAKLLMSEVKAQWYELMSWMGMSFINNSWAEEANLKTKPAWRLVGRCVAAAVQFYG